MKVKSFITLILLLYPGVMGIIVGELVHLDVQPSEIEQDQREVDAPFGVWVWFCLFPSLGVLLLVRRLSRLRRRLRWLRERL